MIKRQSLYLAIFALWAITGFASAKSKVSIDRAHSAYQTYDAQPRENTAPTLLGLQVHEELAKGNADSAERLLLTDMKGNNFPEINHWLLAKVALQRKKYNEFRKHILAAKKLPWLKNTTLAHELYASLPAHQQSWLVDQMINAGYFDAPPSSSCPYFELQKRRERAEFLFLIAKNNRLNQKIKNNLFYEFVYSHP